MITLSGSALTTVHPPTRVLSCQPLPSRHFSLCTLYRIHLQMPKSLISGQAGSRTSNARSPHTRSFPGPSSHPVSQGSGWSRSSNPTEGSRPATPASDARGSSDTLRRQLGLQSSQSSGARSSQLVRRASCGARTSTHAVAQRVDLRKGGGQTDDIVTPDRTSNSPNEIVEPHPGILKTFTGLWRDAHNASAQDGSPMANPPKETERTSAFRAPRQRSGWRKMVPPGSKRAVAALKMGCNPS